MTDLNNLFRKIFFAAILMLLFSGTMIAQKKAAHVSIIFDTDMGPDYDDVGAITLLHAFADKKEARILATIASTKYSNVGPVLSVFNTYFNRPDIPVAVPKGSALELRDWQHWSDTVVARYPHSIQSNADAADPVALYRKLLAAQPDHSVTIVTVGFLTNLANLLRSSQDQYSPQTGEELVKRKVKLLVSMAGKFPSGKEFNVDRDFVSSKYAFEHWPGQVIFTGFEIGEKIKCGLPLIHNDKIQNSPVKDVFRICIPMAAEDSAGRKSWDETAVLVAVKGYQPFYTTKKGYILINEKDGSNSWVDDPKGNQQYLVEKLPHVQVQKLIDELIMHQPMKRRQ